MIWNFRFFSVSLQPFRAISSVGSEHLPYKQGVDGSNPPSPTTDHGGVLVLTALTLDGKHAGRGDLARKSQIPNNQLPTTTMHSLPN